MIKCWVRHSSKVWLTGWMLLQPLFVALDSGILQGISSPHTSFLFFFFVFPLLTQRWPDNSCAHTYEMDQGSNKSGGSCLMFSFCTNSSEWNKRHEVKGSKQLGANKNSLLKVFERQNKSLTCADAGPQNHSLTVYYLNLRFVSF